MKFTSEDEFLPGSDRKRERYGTIPMLAGELVGAVAMGEKPHWPFMSWAASAQFKYPAEAGDFLCRCESAAEAFFARAFVRRGGITYRDGGAAYVDGTLLVPQVRHGGIRLDFVASRAGIKIAVEVDGFTHHSKYDQMAADYLRARRVVALGYVIVRFTSQEVFADSDECWKQLDAILSAHVQKKAG